MEAIKQIVKAMDEHAKETGKMPEIVTVSEQVFREMTLVTPPPGTKAQINGVDCVVSEALTGKTFVFGRVQDVRERPDKETVYHWVGCCLPGNCHDVNGKMCPYHCRTNCRRALAADFAFYAWGELLKEKKGAKG